MIKLIGDIIGDWERAEDLESLVDDILAITDPNKGLFPVPEGTWKMWRDRRAFAGWTDEAIDEYLHPEKYEAIDLD